MKEGRGAGKGQSDGVRGRIEDEGKPKEQEGEKR